MKDQQRLSHDQDPPPASTVEPLLAMDELETIPAVLGNVGGRRDRIVILGQPQAGKTVYLARLYDRYFRGSAADTLSMRTLNGQVHLKLMDVVDQLDRGIWPAATGGLTYVDLEIHYKGERFELVSLDYPGEIFSKAFLLGKRDPECLELIDHLDRAAGIILMVEPSVVASRSRVKAAETEFGMVAAIRYVKDRRDGLGVPVGLLFTKLDRSASLLRAEGGLRGFAEVHCRHILSEVPGISLFAAAAVREQAGMDGRLQPCLHKSPIGLEGPFLYCLEVLVRTRLRDRERERSGVMPVAGELASVPVSAPQDPAESPDGTTRFWVLFTLLTAALFVLGILIALWMISDGAELGAGSASP